MRNLLLVASLLLLVGCEVPKEGTTETALSCKGIYSTRDAQGNLKKFNEYERAGQCWTENVPLTQFEKTSENWRKNNVTCAPVPGFASRTVVSAGNFYSYRDGKVLIDFDSATGIYRRLVLAEDKNGQPTYAKLQGCFFQRTSTGVDAAYGKQLLIDTDVSKLATSSYTDIWEIFTYTEAGSNLNMVRFDDSVTWDFRFCPERTPWNYCTKLRSGNEMFYPVLPLADQNDLLAEAILIRKQFNYTATSKASFDNLWTTVDQTRTEKVKEDYKYDVIQSPDVPRYIDQAWKDYVKGTRPTMPDATSSRDLNLCYFGSKSVILDDGSSAKIFGEICYVNGVYSFTAN